MLVTIANKMKESSLEDSFNWLLTALNRLDEQNLLLSDEHLLSEILEELDIENISFLHSSTVERLIAGNKIPASVSSSIVELREELTELIEEKRSVDQIRNDIDWKNARKLAGKILNEIEKKQPQ